MWWYRALAVFLLLKMSGWVGDSVLNVVSLVLLYTRLWIREEYEI